MERIGNEEIAQLADALANAAHPTPGEIYHAMALAYQGGKIDGGIELADKLLADESTRVKAAA